MRFSSLTSWFPWSLARPPSELIDDSDGESDVAEPNHLVEVDPWLKYYLLSLDGGGIRGLSTLYILEELMRKIGEIERQHDPQATHSFYPDPFIPPRGSTTTNDASYAYRYFPCHYFDNVVGTSTGGLIAIMLGRLRMNVKDCIEEYIRFGGEIFGNPRRAHLRGKKRHCKFNPWRDKYHVAPLREAINRIVENRDPFASHQPNAARAGSAILQLPRGLCQTAVCSVEGSSSEKGWLFRSYQFPINENLMQRNLPTSQYKIELVACATTAAPTFFKPTKHEDLIFYDGGLTANNPCQLAMQEVCDYVNAKYDFGAEDRGHLGAAVSIGTGKVAQQCLRPPRSWLGRYGEAVGWEQRRADNSSSTHGEMVRFTQRTREHLRQRGATDDDPSHFTYSRFTVGTYREPPDNHQPVVPEELRANVERMAHMAMDDWNSKPGPDNTVDRIHQATRAWLSSPEIQEDLTRLAQLLVINRRKRAQCDRPPNLRSQSGSPKSTKWYRYASASHWVCGYQNCPKLYYTQAAMDEHVRFEHRTTWGEARPRRVACNYDEPAICA